MNAFFSNSFMVYNVYTRMQTTAKNNQILHTYTRYGTL